MAPRSFYFSAPCKDEPNVFFFCRFCNQWKTREKFSALQLRDLDEGHSRLNPLCKPCAKVGLQQETIAFQPAELSASLSMESRYALATTFCGEFEGIPMLPVDVLLRIISFVVQHPAPFISDRGDGTFRCTACPRDFDSFEAALQHTRTSQRHVKALQVAAS
eukprot:gnl/MRDRNA2_/MRDRNA2_231488_c0_seq1.p2 gnl/MRDRNA2_/MRDRNA2_231488_c0~~gnl/MRDRNA2_/MRDRNA2_231488_c0_seq1.p2  ORF type:complete len:162 (-),score=24.65 gnl/MRDRNA2_/MRDRNA2_231488_c0_seq1:45-530(-)